MAVVGYAPGSSGNRIMHQRACRGGAEAAAPWQGCQMDDRQPVSESGGQDRSRSRVKSVRCRSGAGNRRFGQFPEPCLLGLLRTVALRLYRQPAAAARPGAHRFHRQAAFGNRSQVRLFLAKPHDGEFPDAPRGQSLQVRAPGSVTRQSTRLWRPTVLISVSPQRPMVTSSSLCIICSTFETPSLPMAPRP